MHFVTFGVAFGTFLALDLFNLIFTMDFLLLSTFSEKKKREREGGGLCSWGVMKPFLWLFSLHS